MTWITKGPDGAIWFTDESGIARRGSDGSIRQIWSGLSYPSAIAAAQIDSTAGTTDDRVVRSAATRETANLVTRASVQ